MTCNEELAFRIKAVRDRRRDGYGDVRSLRAFMGVVRNCDVMRLSKEAVAQLRAARGDAIAAEIVSEIDEAHRLLAEAAELLEELA